MQRKIHSIYKVLYRNHCMERLYLPRPEGGVELVGINDASRNTILNLEYYLKTIQDGHLLKLRNSTRKTYLNTTPSQSLQTSSKLLMNMLIKQVTMRIQHRMSNKHSKNIRTCTMNTPTKGKFEKW